MTTCSNCTEARCRCAGLWPAAFLDCGPEVRVPAFHMRAWRPAYLIVCALVCAGCNVKTPVATVDSRVQQAEDISATAQQARLRIRALVLPLSGAIVESADRISAATEDHAVRRAALVWKLEAIPALRESLFRPNPFTAIADAWVLSWQMNDYFESGRGKEALGEAAPIAVTTCKYLQEQLAAVAASLTHSGDVSDLAKVVRDFATSHPITMSIASRESTLSRVTERELHDAFSMTEAAGSMVVTVDDLGRRMDVYSVQLLDQGRWQAELMAMDMAADFQADKAIPLAESAVQSAGEAMAMARELAPQVREALDVAGSTPDLISRERAAAVRAMSDEISRVIKFAQDERIAAMEQLSKEREAVMADVRQTILDEHKALIAETERISSEVVDHAINKVARLVAVVLIATFTGLAILLFLARRLFVARPARVS